MIEVALSPEAETELDEIWLYIARSSGSVEIAGRMIDSISQRFWLLAQHPHLGRRRDDDLAHGLRSLVAEEYVILYRLEEHRRVSILHIFHGSRDIASFYAG